MSTTRFSSWALKGTRRGGILIPPGCSFEAIDAMGVKGQNPIRMLIALLCLTKGIVQSGMIIRRFAPHLVIGCGGYVSAPVLVAAYLRGVKRAIHEQNALPGLTNRVLGTIAQIIFISFQQSLPYFSKARTVIAGNPLRKQHLERSASPPSPPPFTLLILGGSLGSHQVNCALIEALPGLVSVREKLTIIHQTGTADLALVKEAYSRQGFAAEVVPFIEQIASAYERAHLIISVHPLMIGAIVGPAAVVEFYVGMRIPMLVSEASWRMADVLFPAVSSMTPGGSPGSGVAVALSTGMRWLTLIVLPLAVVGFVLAPSILDAWLGERPAGADLVMRIGAIVVLLDAWLVSARVLVIGLSINRQPFLNLVCR